MFEKFSFQKEQVTLYFNAALRDIKIAEKSDVSEVVFRFSYDAFLKLAIAFCSKHNLRVKARAGHHIELINMFSELTGDKTIEVIGNEMRAKRNIDLYSGGTLITKKESKEYFHWIDGLIQRYQNQF
ncbi:hypothetical protein COY07_05645 [Candidatus Peregrinibacteria bacterium CG_4_10_14_0_2_um_filter_43_11]|nr:MAG: hypothetical protein COY07_05645 [Candidatus Peregrinibacteria bacterium CG_4_10_14_0_2_um_filter_43_11]